MFVVRDDCRGGGIGKILWGMAIEHLGLRNKGLSAVSKMLPIYRDRAGFNRIAAWSIRLLILDGDELVSIMSKQLTPDALTSELTFVGRLAYEKNLSRKSFAQSFRARNRLNIARCKMHICSQRKLPKAARAQSRLPLRARN